MTKRLPMRPFSIDPLAFSPEQRPFDSSNSGYSLGLLSTGRGKPKRQPLENDYAGQAISPHPLLNILARIRPSLPSSFQLLESCMSCIWCSRFWFLLSRSSIL